MSPSPSKTEPICNADFFWLTGIRDPHIRWLLMFDEQMTESQALFVAENRLMLFRRFAQRPVFEFGQTPKWEQILNLNVAEHVAVLNLSSKHSSEVENEDQFNILLADLSRDALPTDRPLWKLTLINRGSFGSCLFLSVHHAITDGRGMLDVTLSLQDNFLKLSAFLSSRVDKKSPTSLLTENVLPQLELQEPLSSESSQSSDNELFSCIKRQGFMEDLSLAWLPRWPLAEIKSIAASLRGGTVNDAMLTLVAGGLRRYMEARGERVDDLRVHCFQAVMLPRAFGSVCEDLGNSLGLVRSVLHVHIKDPAERFKVICDEMKKIKNSTEAEDSATQIADASHCSVAAKAADEIAGAKQCSVNISSMRGADEPIAVAGHTLKEIRAFGPRFGNIGLQFPMIGYNGFISVGLMADKVLFPNLTDLKKNLQDEYNELLKISHAVGTVRPIGASRSKL